MLWKQVRVGDIIHLSNNELIPADVLVLRSSDPHGLCYVDSCNLDGESNLKQRVVAPGFQAKVNKPPGTFGQVLIFYHFAASVFRAIAI